VETDLRISSDFRTLHLTHINFTAILEDRYFYLYFRFENKKRGSEKQLAKVTQLPVVEQC
jgi:hypothetical protein